MKSHTASSVMYRTCLHMPVNITVHANIKLKYSLKSCHNKADTTV